MTFNVTNNNNGLFSGQPQIQPHETVAHTPALLALGSATVTVRAVDTGGVANGGVIRLP